MPSIITLTTDFGLQDPFVGIMKGVILGIAPSAKVVDITHQIEPQNLIQAALVLGASYSYFPKGTVHVVVVDPGVGGLRRPIAVKSGTQTVVAPDNGVLTPILTASSRAYHLNKPKYFLKNISSTFHGRDLFAPAAAWIARGTPLSKMATRIQDPCQLTLPEPRFKKKSMEGQILYIDHFGNLFTNITAAQIKTCFPTTSNLTFRSGKHQLQRWVTSYSQCEAGECGCIINSWNMVEIFCREGSAAKCLKRKVGDKVTLTITAKKS